MLLAVVIVVGLVVLALSGLTYFAVAKIRPALVKVTAGLWKIFTLSVEIRLPSQRSLPGRTKDDERVD